MYAINKAIEFAFECVPESIIRVNGVLETSSTIEDVQVMPIFLSNPADPYFRWSRVA